MGPGRCDECGHYGDDCECPPVDGPLTADGLRVCAHECATCVFRPGNLMQLHPGRLAGMVRDSLAGDSCIPCHKTLEGERAVCRGFYDRHKQASMMLRFGEIVGVVEVDPDDWPPR